MKKVLLLTLSGLFLLAGIAAYQYVHFYDNKLHIVFCDVGQGDGILITTPDRHHIIVDAGPDNKILSCLSRHMPFWERTIDLIILGCITL
jgi:competence protein ComEC